MLEAREGRKILNWHIVKKYFFVGKFFAGKYFKIYMYRKSRKLLNALFGVGEPKRMGTKCPNVKIQGFMFFVPH